MVAPYRDAVAEMLAEILYSDIEIAALWDFARNRPFPAPANLGRAVLTTAMLGRYLNRRNEPPPGHQKLWEGCTRVAILVQVDEMPIQMGRSSDL